MLKKKFSAILLSLMVVLTAYTLWFSKGNGKKNHSLKDSEFEEREQGMIFIPGNTFVIGRSKKLIQGMEDPLVRKNEIPAHNVEMNGFLIDKREVTNAHFKKFLQATSRKTDLVDPVNKKAFYNWKNGDFPENQQDLPVTLVDWEDANSYCQWIDKRLPTEMEWEIGCQGTERTQWSFGNEFLQNKANTRELKLKRSEKPGLFTNDKSSYDLQDMSGNVMEWTSSWYLPYPASTHIDPLYGKIRKIIRGGSWMTDKRTARCSNRTIAPISKRHKALGFRCAQDIR